MSINGIDHRHCKWPLGLDVFVLTPQGYRAGRIHRHTKERPNVCDVCFAEVVDMGDANGVRYCHPVAFRNIKPAYKPVRLSRPWYKEPPYKMVK